MRPFFIGNLSNYKMRMFFCMLIFRYFLLIFCRNLSKLTIVLFCFWHDGKSSCYGMMRNRRTCLSYSLFAFHSCKKQRVFFSSEANFPILNQKFLRTTSGFWIKRSSISDYSFWKISSWKVFFCFSEKCERFFSFFHRGDPEFMVASKKKDWCDLL